jgi:hypothetical protein
MQILGKDTESYGSLWMGVPVHYTFQWVCSNLTIKFRVWNSDPQITDNSDRFQALLSPKKKFGGHINV